MLMRIADTDSLIWSIRVDINRINDSYKIYDLKLGDSAELGDGDLLASDSVLNNLFNKLNDRRQARLFRDKIIENKTTPIYGLLAAIFTVVVTMCVCCTAVMIRARKINSKLNKRKLMRKLKTRTNEEED